MATLTEARARWVSENPINSSGYVLSQAEYDAMADDRAAMLLDQMNAEEASAARALVKAQFIAGMDTLRADLAVVQGRIGPPATALTAGELRVGMRDILTSLIWLGERIADGTIETRT